MNKTKIEYLDFSWNPIAMKCTPIHSGCAHCWHLGWCKRFGNSQKTQELIDAYNGGQPIWKEDFVSPKKPSIIGVQYMGDLFHEKVNQDMINNVIGVIADNPQHTFIVLTKRPERTPITLEISGIPDNLWLGVSISTNADLWMVDELLKIKAAVRFVSVEPQLEDIDLSFWLWESPEDLVPNPIAWVIQGAETGNWKRPFDVQWARSMQKQCFGAGTPFFFKQDGQGKRTIDGVMCEEYPE